MFCVICHKMALCLWLCFYLHIDAAQCNVTIVYMFVHNGCFPGCFRDLFIGRYLLEAVNKVLKCRILVIGMWAV